MKPEQLLDAMEHLAPEYIAEAKPVPKAPVSEEQPDEPIRIIRKDNPMKPMHMFLTTVSIAAAAAVCAGIGVFISKSNEKDLTKPNNSTSTELPSAEKNFMGGTGKIHAEQFGLNVLAYDDTNWYCPCLSYPLTDSGTDYSLRHSEPFNWSAARSTDTYLPYTLQDLAKNRFKTDRDARDCQMLAAGDQLYLVRYLLHDDVNPDEHTLKFVGSVVISKIEDDGSLTQIASFKPGEISADFLDVQITGIYFIDGMPDTLHMEGYVFNRALDRSAAIDDVCQQLFVNYSLTENRILPDSVNLVETGFTDKEQVTDTFSELYTRHDEAHTADYTYFIDENGAYIKCIVDGGERITLAEKAPMAQFVQTSFENGCIYALNEAGDTLWKSDYDWTHPEVIWRADNETGTNWHDVSTNETLPPLTATELLGVYDGKIWMGKEQYVTFLIDTETYDVQYIYRGNCIAPPNSHQSSESGKKNFMGGTGEIHAVQFDHGVYAYDNDYWYLSNFKAKAPRTGGATAEITMITDTPFRRSDQTDSIPCVCDGQLYCLSNYADADENNKDASRCTDHINIDRVHSDGKWERLYTLRRSDLNTDYPFIQVDRFRVDGTFLELDCYLLPRLDGSDADITISYLNFTYDLSANVIVNQIISDKLPPKDLEPVRHNIYSDLPDFDYDIMHADFIYEDHTFSVYIRDGNLMLHQGSAEDKMLAENVPFRQLAVFDREKKQIVAMNEACDTVWISDYEWKQPEIVWQAGDENTVIWTKGKTAAIPDTGKIDNLYPFKDITLMGVMKNKILLLTTDVFAAILIDADTRAVQYLYVPDEYSVTVPSENGEQSAPEKPIKSENANITDIKEFAKAVFTEFGAVSRRTKLSADLPFISDSLRKYFSYIAYENGFKYYLSSNTDDYWVKMNNEDIENKLPELRTEPVMQDGSETAYTVLILDCFRLIAEKQSDGSFRLCDIMEFFMDMPDTKYRSSMYKRTLTAADAAFWTTADADSFIRNIVQNLPQTLRKTDFNADKNTQYTQFANAFLKDYAAVSRGEQNELSVPCIAYTLNQYLTCCADEGGNMDDDGLRFDNIEITPLRNQGAKSDYVLFTGTARSQNAGYGKFSLVIYEQLENYFVLCDCYHFEPDTPDEEFRLNKKNNITYDDAEFWLHTDDAAALLRSVNGNGGIRR